MRTCLPAIATLAVLTSLPARADSPLTSTPFHEAYTTELGTVSSDGVVPFLLGDSSSDVKAALINRLVLTPELKGMPRRYFEALARKALIDPAKLDVKHVGATELFVLGYLLALEDYFTLKALDPQGKGLAAKPAVELLRAAAERAPGDYTIQLVHALALGQRDMEKSFCDVWRHYEKVERAFPAARRNLKPAAQTVVADYLVLYRDDCPEGQKAKAREEFNQVYALTSFRQWLVAGTQAGVALWNRETKVLEATDEDFICSKLVVKDDRLFTGSYRRVRSYDGKRWKTYLEEPKSDETFGLFLDGQGVLHAWHGKKFWRHDAKKDAFLPIASPLAGVSPHDVIAGPAGKLWAIDFLDALVLDGKRVALRSDTYPGSDPRSFVRDAFGRFWVVDFNDGFFRWDPARQLFVREPTVTQKGSALAVAPKTEILHLLHYTDGLHSVQASRPTFLDLRSLEYLRALHVDAQGVVWVGGWKGVMRLTGKAGDWQQEILAAE